MLKQGIRFARIAQRYREAMLKSDEAALALLERICLFRLGVDCETLAAIFTGPAAERVSGKSLASLDADELQKTLEWLVQMQILERSESSLRTENARVTALYTIHPAVRDGFLNGISPDVAQASHEAVRQSLEASLGNAPGENPSDPVTLDLLEEIVYHTICSGHIDEAWDIFENRMGGYHNVNWRLGAYERSDRVCRTIEPSITANTHFNRSNQRSLWMAWTLSLKNLGSLRYAIDCCKKQIDLNEESANSREASLGSRVLSDLLHLVGYLRSSLTVADEALRFASETTDDLARSNSLAYRGHIRTSIGQVERALEDFYNALVAQRRSRYNQLGEESGPDWKDRPLFGLPGVRNTRLLFRIGRHVTATSLLHSNIEICNTDYGITDQFSPYSNLSLAEISIASGKLTSGEALCNAACEWAYARDAKEVLCWSSLVQARIELAKYDSHEAQANESSDGQLDSLAIRVSTDALAKGLKIARDCGYGLYHIDLLLEQARLHLLRGDAGAALDDIEVALDTGIAANEETGQVELLAANHEECGYAWAIPAGLQLRAEALLLQAAQTLGGNCVAGFKRSEPGADATCNETRGSLHLIPVSPDTLPADVAKLIDEAEQLLHEALDRWHDLRDPEPSEDNNFVHSETGEEYNYKAAETHKILLQLDRGILTRYPLDVAEEASRQVGTQVIKNTPESVLVLRDLFDRWATLISSELDWLIAPNDLHEEYLPEPIKHAELERAEQHLEVIVLQTRKASRSLSSDGRVAVEEACGVLLTSVDSVDEIRNRCALDCEPYNNLDLDLRYEDAMSGGPQRRSISTYAKWSAVQKRCRRAIAALEMEFASKDDGQSRSERSTGLRTQEDMSKKRFNVALSFPGGHRAYVEEVANDIAGTLSRDKVFYDRFHEAELSRPNLDTYLQEIYYHDSDLVVVVLCKEYDEKEWCGLEFRAIRDLIKRRHDDEIMLVRVADGDVKGVFGIDGYVDAQNRPAAEIAGIICERLKLVQAANA